ncbi:MAG: S8 family peptidase [Synechococcales bacterium]|nr:S8 family peptidase [Synechococcales bacterium]
MAKEKVFGLPRVKVHRQVTNVAELKVVAQLENEQVNWAGSILGIPEVWTQTMGENVKVAVLDTGIDPDHPDLEEGIVSTRDFTGDGIEDANGHGTHCAGIIAARLNNTGFVGVAPRAQLLIGKVLGNDGTGAFHWIADGVLWAIEQGADIISMSLGGPFSSHRLYQAIHIALAKGIMVICAAGNEGSLFQNSIGYPGRYGGVITVASHDENGNRSGFSSRGGEIDVMAPGSNIWSTFKDGGYAELSGTSMAAPFVSGLAALIVSKHRQFEHNETPLENTEDLKNHLLWMAAHPGYHDNEAGYGPLQPFQYFGRNIQL